VSATQDYNRELFVLLPGVSVDAIREPVNGVLAAEVCHMFRPLVSHMLCQEIV